MDFRDYDPAIARWTGIDPVTHHDMSPYMAFDGNPVFWADPSGADSTNGNTLDIFGRDRFDTNGMYIPFGERGVGSFDEYLSQDGGGDGVAGGEKSIGNYVFNENGEYLRYELTRCTALLIIENQTTCKRQKYQFGDPVNDPKDIRDGIINKVVLVSMETMIKMICDSGAFNSANKNNRLEYISNEGRGGGLFDFSLSHIPFNITGASTSPFATPSPMLFIPSGDSYAYNHLNFGNFLYGAAGYSLGFSKPTLMIGAHYNSLFNSDTNGYPSSFDSADDQWAIKRGVDFGIRNNF